jgi:hypothetical protein
MRLFCAVAVLCLCSTAFAFCVTPHRSALTTTAAAVRPHSCSPWTSSRTALHITEGKKKEAAAEDGAKADTADSKKSKGKQELKAEEAPAEEPKEEAPVDPNAEIKAEIKVRLFESAKTMFSLNILNMRDSALRTQAGSVLTAT